MEAFLSQVSSFKLDEFSAELCFSEVISLEVKGVFAAMDDSVAPKLRLRYLLRHVCEGVRNDIVVFHRFLQVLTMHGRRAEEVAKHILEEWHMSERGGEDEAEFEGESSSLVELDDLKEEDVVYLMKILSGVTNIWEELGIALGLNKAVLEDCRSGRNNKLRLHNLLCMWVKGKYQTALPATLKNLKQELASELVGVADVALGLEEKFLEAKRPVPITGMERTPGSATPLSIVCQSNVADGPSTLLEVQVKDSESVCYLWMRDGQSISDNLAYSGTHSARLSISTASHGIEGKYACLITKGSEKVISKEVLMISPEKKHLIKLYSKDADVPEDSWPPKVTSSFISLALITKGKGVTDDYKYSVRGDVDDILEKKVEVEFEEVFGKYKSGDLVLVEGRPGSGKTTLVHKVTRDWATGGEVLKGARLVFLITLRNLANRKTEKLSDLLGLLYLNTQKCEKLASDIENSDGEGVCFVIDGLDEFHPQNRTKSVIHQLLYNKYLPEAMIIVASRPVATGKLRSKPHVTRRIEVLGFSYQQILEYIDKYPFTSKSTSPAQLKAYLNCHRNLLHMCYLPVHAAMICFLYEHEKGVIPPTETEIYEHFTRFMVLRKQRRSDEDAHLASLEDLCGDDKEYFSSICLLAFDMTIRSMQTVLQRNTKVPLSFDTGSNDTSSLGLVTIDRTAGLDGLDNTYAFLHLTFQEYLAAFYLANLKVEEQMKMMTLYAGKNHMRVVWKFYSGMVKFENNVAQIQLIIKSAGGMRAGDASLYAVQCAYESQQRVFCDTVVEGNTGKLSYTNCIFSPADMTAVGYVISTTSHSVTELVMTRCHLNNDHVFTLVRKVSHNKLNCINNMRFHGNSIGAAGAEALADGLKSCSNLQTLYLSDDTIGDEGAIAVAGGLMSCINLLTLDLSGDNIGSEGVVALADGLKSWNNLQGLYLSNNCIGAEGALALAGGLKFCNNLHTLDLIKNNISDNGAVALADGLKSCNNLQILDLSFNSIGHEGAVALADGLKSCINLQTLGLDDNNIGDEGAVALADGLKSCNNLQALRLCNCNIDDDGATVLKTHLKCPDLRLKSGYN